MWVGNKSCGSDNIHPCVLQKTANTACVPLELIFKLSIDSGECPDDWRSANVTPIHKKGDKTNPSNYRPVSLTSQVCKVLESMVRKHILEHLAVNNILSDRQHGFREGRSCLTNLLEIMENWTEILDMEDGIDVSRPGAKRRCGGCNTPKSLSNGRKNLEKNTLNR